ncbi:primosomal protein N' [Patescibacteria group bacterium]|nr:primosomal protein N' [Patescibacteria group bacterium]
MIAKIIINEPFLNKVETLTYAIPKEYENICAAGSICTVPFRNTHVTGIIIETLDNKFCDQPKLKAISSVSDLKLQKWQIDLAKWITKYYLCPLYKAFKLFLPQNMWKGNLEFKSPTVYKLAITNNEAKEFLQKNKKYKKQHLVVKHLLINGISQRQNIKTEKNVITTLIKKGIIQELDFNTTKTGSPSTTKTDKFVLSENQQKVFDNILDNRDKTNLIHGLSASGKTEIYLHLALKILSEGKQALIIAPELTLTHHLIQYFKKFFPQSIAILHSKISESQKKEIWHQIYTGQIKIVIGSRMALFYPYQNLGLIVMDEEHEWSYKSDQAPRYQTKETLLNLPAIIKKTESINPPLIVLASATPSIESYYLATKKDKTDKVNNLPKIKLHYLDKDINESEVKTKIMDMREEFHRANFTMFSEKLQAAITKRLENKKQVLMIINRRGYASSVCCRDCGHIVQCDNCQVPITLYKNEAGSKFFCHHCAGIKQYLAACPSCGSINIKELGVGTQKVMAQLRKIYPLAKILQVDGSTMKNLSSLNKFQEDLNNSDIIIGTQMAAKGLDLKRCTLSVILLADLELSFPDYNSSERAYQLFVQTRGRAGRHENGEFIIQTYQPDHPVVISASAARLNQKTYLDFYNTEIEFRKELSYPPFTKLARLNIKDQDELKAKNQASIIEKMLQQEINSYKNSQHSQITAKEFETKKDIDLPIINKSPDLIYRKKGLYNWHILIRSNNPQKLIQSNKSPNTIIDINPLSTL